MILAFYWLKKAYPLLLIVAGLLLFWFWHRAQQKVKDYEAMYRVQHQQTETWRDAAGKHRARAEAAEVKAENVRLVLGEELKRTLEQQIGNLRRNLISYSSVQASTSGHIATGLADTVYVINDLEPLPAKKFFIQNPDLTFRGVYLPQLDTLIASYRIQHNFEITYYYRRPGKPPFNIFRRKQAVAEIKFDNEGSQADSLFTVVMERRKGLLKRLFR